MTPLADAHVHLLAALDDGPRSRAEAVEMCRVLVAEGARHATALAHQNEGYPENTPARLTASAADLAAELRRAGIPLAVYPAAEVMLTPTTVDDWRAGRLLTVGGHGRWLLAEMPHGVFLDVLPAVGRLRADGVGVILAHAERYPELLDDPALAARWIAAGCLIQVTAAAVADPRSRDEDRGLRRWLAGGFVHLLGSDGHRMDRRPPALAAGYRRLEGLVGRAAAERIGGHWGVAVLQGLPVTVPPPAPPRRSWFTRLFGG